MDPITFIDYSGTLVFAISGVLAGVDRKFDSEPIAMSISITSVIIIRILAIKKHWELPFNP